MLSEPKVLVIGAAGTYGNLVVPACAARGLWVRGAVHRAESIPGVLASGAAEAVVVDLDDPASLVPALEGIKGVFYIGPEFTGRESTMGKGVVAAAKAAAVEQFVFSSVQHTFLDMLVNHYDKLPIHQALLESGMNYTILLPTTFMQSIEVFQWETVLKTGVYRHPIKRTARQSWVDYRDVAEAAAIAFTSEICDGGIFELCAPGLVSTAELADKMGHLLGREIAVEDPDFEDYIKPFGIPDQKLTAGYKAICDWYSLYGFPGGNDLSLRTILGRKPRTLDDYLRGLVDRTGSR